MKSLLQYVSIAALVVGTAGCGPSTSHLPKTVNASGIVTLDGSPVDKAAVVFIAEQGNYNATAMTDASGKFSLNAFIEKTGAVPGAYKIEINKTLMEAGTDKKGNTEGIVNVSFGLPRKYASFTTSELKFTIPESGTEDIKLELKSK
ncbi:MAG: carboxypeptidase-like regulatory domain-containing protein [Pirellulales bacterium]